MRLSVALLVVLLVVGPVAGAGAGFPDDRARSLHAPPESPAATDSVVGANNASASGNASANATVSDGTELYVSIRDNGNARWDVTARFVLRDENETEAFRELARSYENGNTEVGFTRETFQRILDHAATDTDRPMALRNVNRSARLLDNGSVGVLSLSFTWRNFTRVENDRIFLGDVFWVGSETWLPSLTDDQTLVIEGPSGYYVEKSAVSHNGTRTTYEGPRTFEQGDFSITYSPKDTTGPDTTSPGLPNISGTPALIVLLLLFGSGVVGTYAWSQRRGADPDPVEDSDDERGSASPTPTSVDDEASGDDEDDTSDGEPAPELLSDEERVLRLLRDNDGRMKQGQIVKETNWSNAKVSQLLSKMNENDDVDKLRIGRENLITLPDEDVTDTD